MTAPDKVILVEDLRKVYKPKGRKQASEVKAIDGISFGIERGEFFGLLGPNGAGKTTTIGILTTRIPSKIIPFLYVINQARGVRTVAIQEK